ncbi:MAG: DUF6029 family protein [Bacteroidota bacterium]
MHKLIKLFLANKSLGLSALVLLLICQNVYSQDENRGRFSGNLESNGNFFIEDTDIGAANTPQYDHQLFGADAWLQLNYSVKGFDMGLRFDLFNNSNLLNPQGSYTDQGIGRWFIKKKIHKLGISAGYLYDQIGSGIIFRAYEQRPLLIDNALYGVRLTYDLAENWEVKAFTGRQKLQFDTYGSIIKGISIDGFLSGGGEDGKKFWSMAPGFGIVNRTIDDQSMNTVVSTINTYSVVDSIGAKYNTYAFSAYNTLTFGDFSWFVEGAYKTEEVFFDPFAIKTNRDGSQVPGKLVFDDGYVLYSSVSFAKKGLGITLEGKRTSNFTFRTNPLVTLNRGMINFLPPMTRVNTYRLLARYSPAVQELGEQAIQFDIRYSPKRKLSFNVNVSFINDLKSNGLYRELYTEVLYKYKRKWQIQGGVQLQEYNQEIYETKPEKGSLGTVTPYLEFLYKLSRKKALRFELQYMHTGREVMEAGQRFNDGLYGNTNRDFGNWIFGLVELSLAPHWTFTVSDMFNVSPDFKNDVIPVDNNGEKEKIHYPRFDIYYTFKANRISLSYIKQVEGIVCAGGVCRLEPAFSGVKLGVSSTF